MSGGRDERGGLLLRGIFVTGTDTGVGKTVCSAALMHRYRFFGVGGVSDTPPTPKRQRHILGGDPPIVPPYSGQDLGSDTPPTPRGLRYWKPIQTGIEQDDDTAEVRNLGQCRPEEIFENGVRLERPVSPHLAARMAGSRIDVDALVETLRKEAPGRWIVEGAGGVLVPVNDSLMMIDVMTRLQLAVLVVSRSTLGTINHTLMTLEALRARSLTVAGVVMIGDRNRDNREAVEAYGRVPVVGEMPRFERLSGDLLAEWARTELDPSGRLERCFE